MDSIGRPTQQELDRIEELADEHFVGDKYTVEAKLWDDGDVHLEAYSTLGGGYCHGYPSSVAHHRQLIRYERSDASCDYLNRVVYTGRGGRETINTFSIEW